MEVEEIEMTEDECEEMINDAYDEVNICGYNYEQGTLLRRIDPINFRCILSEEPIRYKCGICGSIYNDEDKAEDCCSEHKE